MLDTMRNLSKSLVSKALMVLLVISFAVWGVGDIARSGGANYAAKVGGERISLAEFSQQRTLVAQQLEQLGIGGLRPGALELTVLRQLIQQKQALLAMRDLGLFVDDTLVASTTAQLPEFKNPSGKFDRMIFTASLARQNTSEQTFIAQMRRNIAGQFFTDSIAMGDIVAPQSINQLQTFLAGETRDVVVFTIPANAPVKAASEAELQAFYESNSRTYYMNPEQRTLEYVTISPAEIDALVVRSLASEAAVGKLPASAPTDANTKREARDRVLQELSNRIEDSLAGGQTMAQAFRSAGVEVSVRRAEGVTEALAATTSDDVLQTVYKQGLQLGEGEVSRLIRSPQGTSLMLTLTQITPATPKPYASVAADVKKRYDEQQRRDAAREKALALKATLAKNPDWHTVANAQNVSTRVVSGIARPSTIKPGGANSPLPPSLQTAVFERAVGEIAGPQTRDNGEQLIALITASKLPERTAILANTARPSAARNAALAQEIEGRMYQSFGQRHAIDINPQLMRSLSAGQ